MKNIKLKTINDLLKKAKGYIKEEDQIKFIRKAYRFAEKAHEGTKRISGEDYIQHPLNTAIILTDVFADSNAIAAALLHDVIEDCNITSEDIEKEFGKEITKLVDGVTKISELNYKTDNEYIIANYRKIIIGMSEDVRIIIIKLADRLHNMRTLFALPEKKQKRIAKETLDILAPIAHRLGIHKIKSELEDLCLKYLKPDDYYEIVEKLNKTKTQRDKYVKEMMVAVSEILNENDIKHEIKGRSKSICSIYKKVKDGKKFEDIYDLLAMRILVEKETECYIALGLIHSKYKPMSNRFKDYIAQPKTNMYQSLHTTIFGIGGSLFEVQIKTEEMNEVAEYGIASHTSYKENTDQSKAMKNATEKKILFFREILELQDEEKSNSDFVNQVKEEIFGANIYVHTPKGDVVELPSGSTPIDFAYRVHTEVGNKMIGAIVNNKIASVNHELQNGDIIKINTSKAKEGPNKDWIDFVKTTSAKNKIKAFFTKNTKEEKIKYGEKELLNEIRKRNLVIKEILDDKINEFMKDQKITSIEDLYYYIGTNKYTANQIINQLTKEHENKEDFVLNKVNKSHISKIKLKNDIIVEGIDNIKINLANCCMPIYGDEIVGYITKGSGISVHRASCGNVSSSENRMVDVHWNKQENKRYLTSIMIYANKETNPLVEIIASCQNHNITVDNIKNIYYKDQSVYNISLLVSDKITLEKYIKEVEKINSISKVVRLIK